MFESSGGSCLPITMNVEPAGSGNNNGGNNGGWGDNGAWWIIIFVLFFAFGGWGNGGWGGNGGGGNNAVPYIINSGTDSSIQRGFDNQAVISKLDGINSGICDGFYAQNTSLLTGFGNLQNTVQSGFAGVNNAVCDLGYNIQQGINGINVANMQGNFALQQAINADTVANMQNTNALSTQLANCCCENRQGQADIKYQLATDTCATTTAIAQAARDITENQNANYRALHDEIVANRIEDKNATIAAQNQKIFQLQLAASQADQNAFFAANQQAQTAEILRRTGNDCPTPAYVVQPPQPVTFPTNCCGGVTYASNGCGCGNNGGCC